MSNSVREILSRYIVILNRYGVDSAEDMGFVRANRGNAEFVRLAEVSRWLKKKLTAADPLVLPNDVPDWPLKVVPLPVRYPGEEDRIGGPRPITGYMVIARTGATVRKVAELEASHYMTVEQAEAYARLFAAAPAMLRLSTKSDE